MELLMINKFFANLNNLLQWFTAPRCKCNSKKKIKVKNERY